MSVERENFEEKTDNIVRLFMQSKKNSNCLLELEEFLLSENESCIIYTSAVLKDLFSKIFSQNMLLYHSSAGDSEEKYRAWLIDRYNDFTSHLLTYLSHSSLDVQESALETLISFVKFEGKYPLKKVENNAWYFPRILFQKIIAELLSFEIDQEEIILKFQKYISYDDVKFYLLKSIQNIFSNSEKVSNIFLENCFHLLSTFEYPKVFLNSEDNEGSPNENTLLYEGGVVVPFHLEGKKFCKLFSSVWKQFLKYQLPGSLFRKLLLCLHQNVLPFMQNPCIMTDFFTNSYNKGGLTSLLSLNGLFLLMQKYNVDYPDFYFKLYALFNQKIVNGKFSARFFRLSSLFLSSTHLPECVVAAFAKKLSRISLSSKTDCLLKIIPFVCNLLISHPTLSILIHRTEPKDLSSDPFIFSEADPEASKAADSSLWEIKALQHHYNPVVSRQAKVINSSLPRQEFNTSLLFNLTFKDVYKNERKRKISEVPMAIKKVSSETNWCIF